MGKIIGIDFGTTNSRAAVMECGIPVIIPNDKGQKFTPSVVSITEKGEIIVGEDAKKLKGSDFYHTVTSIKRKLGTDDWICAGGVTYGPQQIAAMIIRKLKVDAEKYLKEEVTDAVIAVPVCFNEVQRQAVRDAGKIAGLNVRRIINETSAVALHYARYNGASPKKIMIVDVGGGSFSVSVLDIDHGVVEVLSSDGGSIGGDDFDKRILDYIVDQYKKIEQIDLSKNEASMKRLMEAVEKAKKELSIDSPVYIKIPDENDQTDNHIHQERLSNVLASGMFDLTSAAKFLNRGKGIEFSVNLFESLTNDLTVKIKETAAKTLSAAGISARKLDKIFLIGEASKIRSVHSAIAVMTGKEPDEMSNSDMCTALGAALQGGILKRDEAISDMLLLDVVTHSVMFRKPNGKLETIIDKNSTIPLIRSVYFNTSYDGSIPVEVGIYQGENKNPNDNVLLGTLKLDQIGLLKKGASRLKADIEINADGILYLTLTNISDNLQRKFRISYLAGISKAGIEKASKELNEIKSSKKENSKLILNENEFSNISKEEIEKAFQKNQSINNLKNKVTEDQTYIKEIKSTADSSDTEQVKEIQDTKETKDITITARPKFCAYCGKPLPKEEKAKFCMFCGERIQNPDESEPENNSSEGEPKNDPDIIFSEGKCAVCGSDVSDTDSVCPKCGFPVISITGKYGTEEIESIKALVIEYRSKIKE